MLLKERSINKTPLGKTGYPVRPRLPRSTANSAAGLLLPIQPDAGVPRGEEDLPVSFLLSLPFFSLPFFSFSFFSFFSPLSFFFFVVVVKALSPERMWRPTMRSSEDPELIHLLFIASISRFTSL